MERHGAEMQNKLIEKFFSVRNNEYSVHMIHSLEGGKVTGANQTYLRYGMRTVNPIVQKQPHGEVICVVIGR